MAKRKKAAARQVADSTAGVPRSSPTDDPRELAISDRFGRFGAVLREAERERMQKVREAAPPKLSFPMLAVPSERQRNAAAAPAIAEAVIEELLGPSPEKAAAARVRAKQEELLDLQLAQAKGATARGGPQAVDGQQPAAAQDGLWSKPNMPSQWGRVFGFSSDTFIRRCKAGTIRHIKHNSKSYSVHVDDLPASAKPTANGQK